ncbi:MAG: VIT domain-containing protein [bacterium]
MKNLYVVIMLCLFLSFSSSMAFDQLRVLDPRNWWSEQGTIEDAFISIRPQGIYIEYSMYLTFSARGNYLSHSDTLEVVLDFNLPDEAVVTDLWLWVNDDIMKAKIMDSWTASGIYEDIVDRRKDPAILYKRQGGYWNWEYVTEEYYELRIFPMAGDETRKVKVSFLLPATWTSEKIISSIPVNILHTSLNNVPNCEIMFFPDEEWTNPNLVEHPEIEFVEQNVGEPGNYLADITSVAMNGNLTLSFDSPMMNGFYLNHIDSGRLTTGENDINDNYYQFVFLPSQFLDLHAAKKVALVIGYDIFTTSINLNTLLTTIKTYALNFLEDTDSINVIYSGLDENIIGENWIAATDLNINNIFNELETASWRSYSNLPSLLSTAVEYLNDVGSGSSILLFSSSDNEGYYETANSIIDDLNQQMERDYVFTVVDFCDQTNRYYYYNDRQYWGNEYLYANLTRMSGGSYFNIRTEPSFDVLTSNAFSVLDGYITSFDLYTSMTDGFCYGRYSSFDNGNVYLNTPVWQIGKYYGNFPFKISAAGFFNNEVFSITKEIDINNVSLADTLVVESWIGQNILGLENESQTNDVVNEIINLSVNERVLSFYTAFLALEPGDTTEPCIECFDEGGGGIINVEDTLYQTEELSDTLIAQAYPNPFNAEVTISVSIPQVNANDNITFKIYDILGQEIKSFDTNIAAGKTRYDFIWNGKNNYGESVSSGIYFFVTKTGKEVKTIKLMMMK